MQAIVSGTLTLDSEKKKYIMPHYSNQEIPITMRLKYGTQFMQKLLVKEGYPLSLEVAKRGGNLPSKKRENDNYDIYAIALFRFKALLPFFKPLSATDKEEITSDCLMAQKGIVDSTLKEFLETANLSVSCPVSEVIEHFNNIHQKNTLLLDGICTQNIELIEQACALPYHLPPMTLSGPMEAPGECLLS